MLVDIVQVPGRKEQVDIAPGSSTVRDAFAKSRSYQEIADAPEGFKLKIDGRVVDANTVIPEDARRIVASPQVKGN